MGVIDVTGHKIGIPSLTSVMGVQVPKWGRRVNSRYCIEPDMRLAGGQLMQS